MRWPWQKDRSEELLRILGEDPLGELKAMHKRGEEILSKIGKDFGGCHVSILNLLSGEYGIYITPGVNMTGCIIHQKDWDEFKKLGDTYFQIGKKK